MYNTKLSPWYTSTPNFPKISKPRIVGCFSIDKERQYHPSAINLKYLRLPGGEDIRLDLNEGYELVVHKPESALNEKIDHILHFILQNKAKLCRQESELARRLDCDFICYRGLLRLLMCTPYEQREDWCILATKYAGNIYLCQVETEQKRSSRMQETERARRFCSYGFKFEQYLLSEHPDQQPETSEPVNESEEFCCIYKTNLENLELIYGAEMDGIISDRKHDMCTTDLNELEFIELKVTRKCHTAHQRMNYAKFNLRKWWCQSFLVGIKNIYVGLRNDRGIVHEINNLEVRSLPKKSEGCWHPNVCMDFLVRFLKAVQQIMENVDCPYTVYKFYWHPQESKSVNFTKLINKNASTFLPDWYINEIKK